MNLETIGTHLIEQGKQLAVSIAVMERVETKLDEVAKHNNEQDVTIQKIESAQGSTQNELREHKKPINHPNGGLPTQVKLIWGALAIIFTGLMALIIL